MPASKITFFETSSRKEGKNGSDNYFPPRVKFSTRHEGAFIPKLNSKSFAGIKDINVDLIFKKLKNYKNKKIFLEKESLNKFILSLFKEN